MIVEGASRLVRGGMHRFQYKAYRRSFARPFSNARDDFPKREGLIVRVEDRDGRVGFGEAAPLPSFGTESFVSALAAAEALEESVTFEQVLPQLRAYPSLHWACETALEMAREEGRWAEIEKPWPVSGLVPDLHDLAGVEAKLQLHFPCLKFKIGKTSALEEMRALDRVIERCDGRVKLRLDANGMLTVRSAREWLEWAAELPIEFIEQPLETGSEDGMRRLGEDFPTPLALDETIADVDDLKRFRDAQWPGLFVIKPSVCGSCRLLVDELSNGAADCVFSSSLETKVGTANAINLAIRFGDPSRALGFGVEELFSDRNVGLAIGPFLQNGMLPSSKDLETLWNLI